MLFKEMENYWKIYDNLSRLVGGFGTVGFMKVENLSIDSTIKS